MKKSAPKASTPSTTNSQNTYRIQDMARDLADTTWRIAVPVVIGAAIGIFGDLKLGSKPWLTLLGTVVGFVFAGLLVRQQLKLSEEEK